MSKPGTQFKWAKAYDTSDYYACMSYSQDGALIVASTYNDGLIMVFDSRDGTLKTSRKYSENYHASD